VKRLAVLAIVVGGLVPIVAGSQPVRAAKHRPQDDRPNVLLIVTDDQRYKAGYDFMPNTMRRFRAEGTEFPNAVDNTPLCCPSRSTIFTGQYAHNHGVWGNNPGPDAAKVFRVVLPGPPSLHQANTFECDLQAAGYHTALFGKYLNKWPLDDPPPCFDEWAIYSSPTAYQNGTWNVDGSVQTVSGYQTYAMADWARGVIDDATEPWFMELATSAPHDPWIAEAKYKNAQVPTWNGNPATAETDESDKPKYVRDTDNPVSQARDDHDGQLRTLMSVDDLVGSVFDELEARGQLDNTMAVFLSDNGYLWAEHGLIGKRPPYRPGVRVPFFVRWHGMAQGKDSRLVGPVDLAPTIYEVAGVTPKHTLDGYSLLSDHTRSRILMEFARDMDEPNTPTWAATYTKDYVFIQDFNDNGSVAFSEYYDQHADPYQLANLLHDGNPNNNPDLDALAATLDADRGCVGSKCP
jgi:arylsulfatase A-like enzyme